MGSLFSSPDEEIPEYISNAEQISIHQYPLKIERTVGSTSAPVRFVIISDTHTAHRNLTVPPGDVLIHCGDWSNHRTSGHDYLDFNAWLGEQPHRHKIIVAGNHEISLPHNPADVQQLFTNAVCLFDQAYEVEGVHLYGAPGIPARSFFYRAKYMQYHDAKAKWGGIPTDTDILITHAPPRFVMDYGEHKGGRWWREGDMELLQTVMELKPKVHCFGHNHHEVGVVRIEHSGQNDSTVFINAAMARNIIPPVVLDFYK